MDHGSEWFANPDRLLEEIQTTGRHWGQLPEIPGYEKLVEVCRGGQGVIYRAVRSSTKQTVAIKLLLEGPSASDETQQRFNREIELAVALRHPGIVRTFDRGVTADGRLYFVMEYVEGVPVDSPSLREPGTDPDLLSLFASICDAVHHAHQHGIIHRDLKPSNILIDAKGRPHILDFGIAKLTDAMSLDPETGSSLSRTGQFLGSLAWASPEQIDPPPEGLDTRTDVYSLGVILYQLLTEQLPHPLSGNLRRTLNDIAASDPPRPGAIRAGIDDDLETIVLRCLAKDPARRYQTVSDLGRDIERFNRGEPIEAKRDRPWYVLRKTLARHKIAVSLAALLFLSAIFFAVAMGFLYKRAAEAEDQARLSRDQALIQAGKAEAVRGFLQEMLASSDPMLAPDPSLTLRQVLDSAARNIEGRFSGRLEEEAEIRRVLGDAYYHLGQFDLAETQNTRALELLLPILGDRDPGIAAIRRDLAVVLTDQRRFDEAELLLEEALSANRDHYGDAHVRTADCLLTLAELRQGQFRFSESNDLYQQAIDIYTEAGGDDRRRLLAALIQWSSLVIALGDIERGEELLKRADEIIDGDTERLELFRTGVLLNRANARFKLKDFESARECVSKAIEYHERFYGSDHHKLAELYNLMGHIHREQKLFPEAERWYVKALEICERLIGRETADGASCLWNIAQARWYQSDFDGAEALFREAIDIRRNVYEEGHHMIQASLVRLGQLLAHAGRWGSAEEFFGESARTAASTYGTDHTATARAHALWAECLVELGRHAEAEEPLLSAYEVLSSTDSVRPAYLEHVLSTLIKLYEATDRVDDASKYQDLLRSL